MDKFLTADIRDVIRLCEANFYDFIVVGSGIGGGVLAQTLIQNSNGKRVLLIEQGGLTFSTHCLNTPRPHWNHNIREGPSQDNDIVYRAVKETINTVTSDSYEYVGGPVYCIGGRANVWGLYTPKMHEAEAKKYFPEAVRSYLFDKCSDSILIVSQSATCFEFMQMSLYARSDLDRLDSIQATLHINLHRWSKRTPEFIRSTNPLKLSTDSKIPHDLWCKET